MKIEYFQQIFENNNKTDKCTQEAEYLNHKHDTLC